ncbi:MAG TPA: hypothetical protein PKW79_04830 [Rhabdochlamydiaceae bacterium]|nr:hypothetical protein [Rhabdochlamydiaceae bacterium]
MSIDGISDEINDYISQTDHAKPYLLPFSQIKAALQLNREYSPMIWPKVINIDISVDPRYFNFSLAPPNARPVEQLLEERGFMFADNRFVDTRDFTYTH